MGELDFKLIDQLIYWVMRLTIHFTVNFLTLGLGMLALVLNIRVIIDNLPSREKTIPWKAVSELEKISKDAPQPTFTYGFPVHIHNTDKTPTGFNRDERIVNFSINTLVDLTQIASCPTVHPSTLKWRVANGMPLDRGDLICFPWALVEVQSAKESAESCYCRAASGAHTALKIRKYLYQHSWTGEEIPPVITFTCCGPEIRMWLAFSDFQLFSPVTVSFTSEIKEKHK